MMNKNYSEIVSTIRIGYNVYNGLLKGYDFTLFILSTILFRKLGSLKLVDFDHVFDSKNKENKKSLNFFITEYKEKLDYLDTVEKVDFEGESIYDLKYLSAYILTLDQKLFNDCYLQMVEECLSIYFSKHYLIIQDSLQPKELTELMSSFLPEDENISVYNPFAGMCSLGLNLSDNTSYLAEEINSDIAKLAELRFLILDKKNFEIKNTDSIKSLNETFSNRYDFIVATPPFVLQKGKDALERVVMEGDAYKTSLNSFIIDASLSKLKENGKLIYTIPESMLYSGTKGNKEFRRNLVVNCQIETLIKLPNKLFKSTAISSYIIVLSKVRKKNSKIQMIDASDMILETKSKQNILDLERIIEAIYDGYVNDYCVFVNVEEIIKNDYNLSIYRYFVEDLGLTEKEKSNLERLGNLVTLVKREKSKEGNGRLLRIRDLSKDKLDYIKTFEDLEERDLKNYSSLLKQDSLLLSSVQTNLKPTAFIKTAINVYYSPSFIFAYIVNTKKVNLDYLVLELHKEYVIKQVKAKRIGTAIQKISRKDISEIKIVLPNLKEQNKKVTLFKEVFFEAKKRELELQKEILGLKDDSFKEFSSMKHTFRNYLNDLKSNVIGTRKFILKNEDKNISLDMVYSKNLDISFKNHLLSLENTIDSMSKTLNDFDSLKEESVSEMIDLKLIIEEAKNRTKNSEIFSFEKTLIDIELFEDEPGFKTFAIHPYVSFNREDFFSIFSNIISNAINHGFTENKKYYIRTSLTPDYEKKLWVIGIENNGNPIPDDFTDKHLKIRGEKTTNSKGNGIGGNDIYELLKKHNSNFELEKDNDSNFKVKYQIMIPFMEAVEVTI